MLPQTIEANVIPAMMAQEKFHGGMTAPTPSGMEEAIMLTGKLDVESPTLRDERFARVELAESQLSRRYRRRPRPSSSQTLLRWSHAMYSILRERMVLPRGTAGWCALRVMCSSTTRRLGARLSSQARRAPCPAF